MSRVNSSGAVRAAGIALLAASTLLVVTGCGPAGSEGGADVHTTTGLQAGTSDFGDVIVDVDGRAVYIYDKDTPNSGESTCYDVCARDWPPVIAGSGTLEVVDLSAKVDTIKRTDGGNQVTVNGWPVYYYANDTQTGDVKGEAADGLWWLLNTSGGKLGK